MPCPAPATPLLSLPSLPLAETGTFHLGNRAELYAFEHVERAFRGSPLRSGPARAVIPLEVRFSSSTFGSSSDHISFR